MAEKKPKPKARKPEPRWKLVERVVALLERTVTPGARVEHDVQVPNLRVPGRTCQCDVVVRSGAPPRETITIVEVQRRGRHVEANMFRGWCEKLEQVGAQHLICVSATGFSQTIIEDARTRGPTVRLVTLRELERNDWPLTLALGHAELSVVNVGPVQWCEFLPAGESQGTAPVRNRSDEPVFERDGYRFCLDEIAKHAAQGARLAIDTEAYSQPFVFQTTGRPYCHVFEGGFEVVHLRCSTMVNIERRHIPVTFFSYEQVGHDGAIAWALTARAESDEPIELHTTFVPASDGRLRCGELTVSGFKPGDGVNVHVGDVGAQLYAFRRDQRSDQH